MSKNSLILLFFPAFFWVKMEAQDTLLFEGKWPYPVQIERETETKVFYRKLSERDTGLYYIEKRFITKVDYQDLSRRNFRPDPVAARPLDVRVIGLDGFSVTKGSLHGLNDSTLFLKKAGSLLQGGGKVETQQIIPLPYNVIGKIQVTKRNQVRNYALVGAASGLVVGMLTGLAVFEDSAPCDKGPIGGRDCDKSLVSPKTVFEKSLLLGFGCAGGGFLAGGIYGAVVKVRIPIGGKRYLFNDAIPRLQRLAWMQQQEAPPLLKTGKKERKNRN